MAVPSATIDKLGVAGVAKVLRFKAHDAYAVIGIDLNDLCALAARMEYAMTDANELRDWQNRLNLIITEAMASNLSEA